MKSDGDDSCLKCIVSELSAVAVSQTEAFAELKQIEQREARGIL